MNTLRCGVVIGFVSLVAAIAFLPPEAKGIVGYSSSEQQGAAATEDPTSADDTQALPPIATAAQLQAAVNRVKDSRTYDRNKAKVFSHVVPQLRPQAVDLLLDALKENSKRGDRLQRRVRADLCDALATMGSDSSQAAPAIAAFLNDPPTGQYEPRSEYAGAALGRIGSAAKKILLDAAGNAALEIRRSALHGLEFLQPRDDATYRAVLTGCADADPSVRRNATDALTVYARETTWFNRILADLPSLGIPARICALNAVSPDTAAEIDTVVPFLDNAAPEVRLAALRAVERGGLSNPTAAKATLKALSDRDDVVRFEAAFIVVRAWLLNEMGDEAMAVRAVLQPAVVMPVNPKDVAEQNSAQLLYGTRICMHDQTPRSAAKIALRLLDGQTRNALQLLSGNGRFLQYGGRTLLETMLIDGLEPNWKSYPRKDRPKAGTALQVWVTAPNGNAVVGAFVECGPADDAERTVIDGVTDAQGKVNLVGISEKFPQFLFVKCDPPTQGAIGRIPVEARKAGGPFGVRLLPTATIKGRLVTDLGAPAPRVFLSVTRRLDLGAGSSLFVNVGAAISDHNGQFGFSGLVVDDAVSYSIETGDFNTLCSDIRVKPGSVAAVGSLVFHGKLAVEHAKLRVKRNLSCY